MLTLDRNLVRPVAQTASGGRIVYVRRGDGQLVRARPVADWPHKAGLLAQQPAYPADQVDHGSAAQSPPWTDRLGAVPPNYLAIREGQRNIFTQWTNATGGDVFTDWIPILDNDPALTGVKKLVRGVENDNCWWIVTVCGTEVVRTSQNPVSPLDTDVILATGLPNSRLRVRIAWIHAGQGCFVDADVGAGVRLAVEGCDVDVKLIGPNGSFREPLARDNPSFLIPGSNGGYFLDSLITGRVVPCWGPTPTGCNCVTLTQTLRVPANTANFLSPVPRFARTLTVSRPGGYPAAGTFLTAGPVAAGAVLRSIFAAAGDPDNSEEVNVPETSAVWDSGAADPAQRLFTLTWGLRI